MKYIKILFITIMVFYHNEKLVAKNTKNTSHSSLSRSDANQQKEKLFNEYRSNILFTRLNEMEDYLIRINDKEMKFAWIVDFPLFEKDDNGSWQPAHHVFSSPHEEDIVFLNDDPGKVRANLFDLVCNGVELGSGSIRIHERALQEKVFDIIGYSKNNVEDLFGHLLTAFDYGVPPHGGMGLGLDRLVAMLCNEESIREVIAFPKTQTASDLFFGAPDYISEEQLKELNIKVDKIEK